MGTFSAHPVVARLISRPRSPFNGYPARPRAETLGLGDVDAFAARKILLARNRLMLNRGLSRAVSCLNPQASRQRARSTFLERFQKVIQKSQNGGIAAADDGVDSLSERAEAFVYAFLQQRPESLFFRLLSLTLR